MTKPPIKHPSSKRYPTDDFSNSWLYPDDDNDDLKTSLSPQTKSILSRWANNILWFVRIMAFLFFAAVIFGFYALFKYSHEHQQKIAQRAAIENAYPFQVVIDDGGLFNRTVKCDSVITGPAFSVIYKSTDSMVVSNSKLVLIQKNK